MKPLAIHSYRRAEEVPGGPNLDAWITVKDDTMDVGATVLVSCHNSAFAARVADAIVEVLPDATRAIWLARHAQADAEERARKAHGAELDAKDRLDAVLHGRRQLFGEALVRVYEDGSAWLLDPVKQEAGFGLRFGSLADIWRAYPELRPVRWSDGDLIVDATIAVPE